MATRYFDKERYSEWVVRQALYWLTPTTPWTLDETPYHWEVSLEKGDFDAAAQLDRLLNDFLLREKLGRQTEGSRQAIANAVIAAVRQRLEDS